MPADDVGEPPGLGQGPARLRQRPVRPGPKKPRVSPRLPLAPIGPVGQLGILPEACKQLVGGAKQWTLGVKAKASDGAVPKESQDP